MDLDFKGFPKGLLANQNSPAECDTLIYDFGTAYNMICKFN